MTIARRFLPPTSLLLAFDAVARGQSVTQAARELNLTQSAVSRQIRSLEDILGAQLFHREKQKVKLTVGGSAYAREIRDALNRISSATLGFRANPRGGSLHLAVLPLFGARWLAPRLPAFLSEFPDITVNLSTRLTPFDFRFDTVDAAIHIGPAEWPGAKLDPLLRESIIPVCCPGMKAELNLATPRDLVTAPLLHLVSRPDAWERWFAAMNVDPGEVHGMLVDQFLLAIEVVRAGLGIALLPDLLVEPELCRGDLVKVIDIPPWSADSYYLAYPDTSEGYPPLAAFRAWIAKEIAPIAQ